MRLAFYAGASTAAAAACLLKAFHQRPNFYSATVYLSQSNACLLILTNLCLVLACGFMFALQRLLYGPLRPIEIEQLSEKAWYAVLDTLLAMPSFREDVGGRLLTMFVLLLAGKVWGWIGEGRVDVLEQQPPANPRLFHARLSTSLALSVIFDIYMLVYCIDDVVADPRPGMMVIFTFEFAIQSIFSIFSLFRYGLIVTETLITKKQTKEAIEIRKSEIRAERAAAAAARGNETTDESATVTTNEEEPIEVDEQEVDVPGWEGKRRYLFMLEAISDFIKLFIYLFFFMVSITFNGLPMHIMRDVYMTFASFSKRVSDYVAYRKATSDMNTRYPDATTEEIRDDACIVCRESMVAWNITNDAANAGAPPNAPGEQVAVAAPTERRRDEGLRAKKLPCGHILHLRCLKAWLERQQVCPTCRRPVVSATEPPTGPAPNQDGQVQQGGQQPHQQQQQQNQQNQQQQPRAARPNRARIFNFGPIRVGLVNAPNGQLQNIVDQLRNPDAQNQNAPGPTNQPAPDATAVAQQGAGSRTRISQSGSRGARASLPTQIHLMQIEQRLLQEAHNLGIEQQQLATLRLMEAELARLRAQRTPNQAPVGIQRQSMPMAGFQPSHSEVLQGNPSSQLGSGHDALPSGLTLPEGWTILPLHRLSGGTQAHDTTRIAQDHDAHVGAGLDQSGIPPDRNIVTSSDSPSNAVQSAASAPLEVAPSTHEAGPTDDNGSPLFIPATGHNTNLSSSSMNEPVASEGSTRSTQKEPEAPWATSAGWDFSNNSVEDSTSSHEHRQSYSGKGKGKAVEVEDAPDPDADPSS